MKAWWIWIFTSAIHTLVLLMSGEKNILWASCVFSLWLTTITLVINKI